jgi:hypothetical protein
VSRHDRSLDFGIDLGSLVGLEYYDQAPFKFIGTIERTRVEYIHRSIDTYNLATLDLRNSSSWRGDL